MKKVGFETHISNYPSGGWYNSDGDYGHNVIRTQYNEDGSQERVSKSYSDVTGKLVSENITITNADGTKDDIYKFYNENEKFHHQQEVLTHADGNKTSIFTWYDEDGNITGKQVHDITYLRDENGQMIEAITTTTHYDKYGHPTSKKTQHEIPDKVVGDTIYSLESSWVESKTTYQYNADGSKTETTQNYDSSSRITSIIQSRWN